MISKDIIKLASSSNNFGLKNDYSHKTSLKNMLCGDKITLELIVKNKKVISTLPQTLTFFLTQFFFFPVQLGHPKLSGYGLLSTQALQNRSQKYSSVSQSGATAFPWRDPDPPAASRPKGVNRTANCVLDPKSDFNRERNSRSG